MLPHEEDWLIQILAEMLADSTITRDAAAYAMTSVITDAYRNGLQPAGIVLDVDPALTDRSIRTATVSMMARTGQIWDQMDQQISDTILGAIKAGKSYDDTMDEVNRLITGDWGGGVEFDNVGNVQRRVRVNPDGTMDWEKHEISRKAYFATDAYAENISRTVVHESWNAAHHDQYQSIGLSSWVYLGVNDAATRITHLALHGKVIRYGSPEDDMARAVMEEPNCRCYAAPHWDDPEYDTPPEKMEAQRVKAARKARAEVASDSEDARFLDGVILTHKPFEDAADHTELRQMIAAKWQNVKVDADIDKMDLDTTKKTLGAISAAAREYPGITQNIYKLKDTIDNPDEYARIIFSSGGTGIPKRPDAILALNRDFYYTENVGKLTAAIRVDKVAGMHPSGNAHSIGLHEFGHLVEVGLAYRLRQSLHAHATNTVSKATKNILLREPTRGDIENLCASISEYARLKGPHEAVAEAFADVYANAGKAQPISREIVEIIRKEWNLL